MTTTKKSEKAVYDPAKDQTLEANQRIPMENNASTNPRPTVAEAEAKEETKPEIRIEKSNSGWTVYAGNEAAYNLEEDGSPAESVDALEQMFRKLGYNIKKTEK